MQGSAACLNLLCPSSVRLHLCIWCVYKWVGTGLPETPHCSPMAWWCWSHSEDPIVSSSAWNNPVVVFTWSVLYGLACWPVKPRGIKIQDIYWIIKYFLGLFIHQIFIECRGPGAKCMILPAYKQQSLTLAACFCLERLCDGQAVFTRG